LSDITDALKKPLKGISDPVTSAVDGINSIGEFIDNIKNAIDWIVCFIRWIIEFMGWFVDNIVCLAKFQNPLCWLCLLIDVVFGIFKYLAIFVVSLFYLFSGNAFKKATKSVDNLIASIDNIYKIRYPDFITKSCYYCTFKLPPRLPKFGKP